ncbi:hypothetical protein ACFQ0T_37390 [Kitasatospora gansuensis]
MIGAITSGTPWASASQTVFSPPWLTTASRRGISSSTGTRGRTRTCAGGSGTVPSGAATIAWTRSPSGRSASTTRAWKSWARSSDRVPTVTRTWRRAGSSQSRGKAVSGALGASAGPTRTALGGHSSGPVRASPVKPSSRCGENRRSCGGSPGNPAAVQIAASRCRIHASTLGRARYGRVSSMVVGAIEAQGSPARWAASAPATACWSTASTSGRKAATARSMPGSVLFACGTM